MNKFLLFRHQPAVQEREYRKKRSHLNFFLETKGNSLLKFKNKEHHATEREKQQQQNYTYKDYSNQNLNT